MEATGRKEPEIWEFIGTYYRTIMTHKNCECEKCPDDCDRGFCLAGGSTATALRGTNVAGNRPTTYPAW